jgi:hypothetical protein
MIGGTYIKPTASLGVMWAYRRGELMIRRGRVGGRKVGVRIQSVFDEMNGQLPRLLLHSFNQSVKFAVNAMNYFM